MSFRSLESLESLRPYMEKEEYKECVKQCIELYGKKFNDLEYLGMHRK